MTDINVNNKKTDLKPESDQTIQELMDHVLNEVISQKEVVTGINVNDEQLDFEKENEILNEKVSNYQKINFQVQSSIALALESLDSCDTYIDVLISRIKEITADYHAGEVQRANEGFSEILETVDLFVQLMTRINRTLAQHHSSFEKPESVQNLEIHLLSILKSMIPARENNDIIMLCDLLEYELIDNLTQWKTGAIPLLKQVRDS